MFEFRFSVPTEMIDSIQDSEESRDVFEFIIKKLILQVIKLYSSRRRGFESSVFHSSDMITNKDCAICLEPIKLFSMINVLPCKHGFHPHCIEEIIEHNHDSCPLCRKSFYED